MTEGFGFDGPSGFGTALFTAKKPVLYSHKDELTTTRGTTLLHPFLTERTLLTATTARRCVGRTHRHLLIGEIPTFRAPLQGCILRFRPPLSHQPASLSCGFPAGTPLHRVLVQWLQYTISCRLWQVPFRFSLSFLQARGSRKC